MREKRVQKQLNGYALRAGPHPVRGVPGLFNELLYFLNVVSYVVNLGEL